MDASFRQYIKSVIIVTLCFNLTFLPALSWAKPLHNLTAPSSTALPVTYNGATSGDGWSVTQDDATHYMQVDQEADTKVVIAWDSFDIGSQAHVHFEQGESGIALNRIYSYDPSRIFGQLTATGSVYLVNQNGILFGEGSRVNLNSLVASSLNISFDDVQNGVWSYSSENYMSDPAWDGSGEILNRGTIEASAGGSILLLGANVTNEGTLSVSDGGRIFLSAGSQFEWSQDTTNGTDTVSADYSGTAVNSGSGQILADVGDIGIYGRIVRQEGQIRSVSTVQTGSSIMLVASERITTGSGSSIVDTFKELEGDVVVEETVASTRVVNIKAADSDNGILIDLYGEIEFPAGDININAGTGGRIYLGPDSVIDVSGSWETLSALDQVITIQANSLELRDEFLQQEGLLLGETFYFLPHEGISIGNAAEHLANRSKSVWELKGNGGNINLSASGGEVIAAEGSLMDVSGGGTIYQGGLVQTTKLLASDGRLFDISEAPDYLTYVAVINPEQLDDGTYVYNPVHQTYVPEHTVGQDAGSINIGAKTAVVEGSISAGVTQGLYQVNYSEVTDSLGYVVTDGTRIPLAGTLKIGTLSSSQFEIFNPQIESIVIMDQTGGLASDFDPETDELPEERYVVTDETTGDGYYATWLSDDLLSNSGLATIQLGATRTIETRSGTTISLAANGSFEAVARRIFHQGAIYVPSGDISLLIKSNYTTNSYDYTNHSVENPNYISQLELGPDRVELASGSVLSTSGQVINDTGNMDAVAQVGHYDGGTITIQDQTRQGEGVVVRDGATVDVSGGYHLDVSGDVADAGDAGSIAIQGETIILDGTVLGLSMIGQEGGTISLHAREVRVTAEPVEEQPEAYSSEEWIPDSYAYKGQVVIADSRFDNSGFTNIELKAVGDVTVEQGVSISPSTVKLNLTSAGQVSSIDQGETYLPYLGGTSITIEAGENFEGNYRVDDSVAQEAQVTVEVGTELTVAPEGTITVSAPTADIAGTFTAPAGTISVSTTSSLDGHLLLIRDSARFYAQGLNRYTGNYIGDDAVWDVLDGGTVTFDSDTLLQMDEGALVDVSGSSPVISYRSGSNNRLVAYTEAGDAGTVTLSFAGSVDSDGNSLINGEFIGHKYSDNAFGGVFSISRTSEFEGFTLLPSMTESLEQGGFESFSIYSPTSVHFSGSQELDFAAYISIDTPLITADEASRTVLNSEWVDIKNTTLDGLYTGATSEGSSILEVNAGWIDLTGDIKTSGFDQVSLISADAIRAADAFYKVGSSNQWSGNFSVNNDLLLTASVIYPKIASDFTFDASSGKITILPSENPNTGPIYSALGTLRFNAENIEHWGVIQAPIGQIEMNAPVDRIFLGQGSYTSVTGELAVNYGEVSTSNLLWYGQDKDNNQSGYTVEIEALEEKGISITSDEFIGMNGSTLSLEGGGAVFGYAFLAGTDGSVDPLTVEGRYVILPGRVGQLPGKAVYIEEGNGVEPGLYTLLPASYAFIEGAKIIQFQGAADASTALGTTNEGYSLAVGYEADSLTGLISSGAQLYSVRDASDVLSEGYYEIVGIETGNAGSLTVEASTNVMGSTIAASAASSDYRGGRVTLSGQDVILGASAPALTASFNFDTQFEDDAQMAELIGKLYLDARTMSEAGLWELNIGSENITQTITFEDGAYLEGGRIGLTASGDIYMGQGAGIAGTGTDGYINIQTGGSLYLEEGAFLTSSNYLGIDAAGLENQGTIYAETQLSLSSDRLIFETEGTQAATDGLVITQDLWSGFGHLEQLNLTGREYIGFYGSVSLDLDDVIIVADTPMMIGLSDTAQQISLTADQIQFQNTQEDPAQLTVNSDHLHQFTATAQQIWVGPGQSAFSGFSSIGFYSQNNLTFLGEGGLDTHDANLLLSGSVITGSYRWIADEDNETYSYEALDYHVDAGTGTLSMSRSGGTDLENENIGGILHFTAQTIESDAAVSLDSGIIYFEATGSGDEQGIFMRDGASVSAAGSLYDGQAYDAGTIIYEAQDGAVHLAQGSTTDVSALINDGNAGTIKVINPYGNATLEGDLTGSANTGNGGQFVLDTSSMADVSNLVDHLSGNGFSSYIGIRLREGSTRMAADVAVSQFHLTADQGDVSIGGNIDASGTSEDRYVWIFAGNNLDVASGVQISAAGTGDSADGGEIMLGSGIDGAMDISGAGFDVSSADGDSGTVYLRAAQTAGNTEVALTAAGTQFTGDNPVTVEAYRRYEDTSITTADANTYRSNAQTFMNIYGQAVTSRLEGGASGSGILLIPGIEVVSSTDLSLSSALDMTSWRFGTENVAGAITFKAAGNLNINQNLLDHPTSSASLQADTVQQTTRISLASGSVLSSSDITSVDSRSGGNLNIADARVVYTEGGDIFFASGNDTNIGRVLGRASASSDYMTLKGMNYNLASYGGTIRGFVGNDLNLDGGVIQTAVSDIHLTVNNDINLNTIRYLGNDYLGSIRTTGQPETDFPIALPASYRHNYTNFYNSGGSIYITAGGDILSYNRSGRADFTALNEDAWDTIVTAIDFSSYPYTLYDAWSASYEGLSTTQGIAAMGGGDIVVNTGGQFFTQIGTFGTGDLSINAAKNVDGRFLNRDGVISINSYGSFGSMNSGQVIEAFDSEVIVRSQGNLTLASVVNPTITRSGLSSVNEWNLTYTEDSSVSLISGQGSITLTGDVETSFDLSAGSTKRELYLPASLYMQAGLDIILESNFYMMPSSSGNLELYAGRDIIAKSDEGVADYGIIMSDADPDDVYGNFSLTSGTVEQDSLLTRSLTAQELILHEDDTTQVLITAGRDIESLGLSLPKSAAIFAGRDINNLDYIGQNLSTTDETIIFAGRNITYTTDRGGSSEIGLLFNGPGLFRVQAGDSIDLGSSLGIQAVGGGINSYLPDGSNDLLVIAGTSVLFTVDELNELFAGLRQAGTDFVEAKLAGNDELAQQIVEEARISLIEPIFGSDSTVSGNISLINSKIFTSGGDGDIITLAGGQIDVGVSSIQSPPILGISTDSEKENSGFYTTAGGALKMFANGDINVNESRVMTFNGGDIDIISNYGDINAGRGSKAAVASSSVYFEEQSDGTLRAVFEPPAVGSGIRATAPDINLAGDIYATAFSGDIDAGEAGLSGRNVTLAAGGEVLNAQNIETTGLAIGFETPGESGGSIEGISGSGGLDTTSGLTEESQSVASARKSQNEGPPEGYSVEPRWVDVKVIDFEQKEDEEEDEKEGQEEASVEQQPADPAASVETAVQHKNETSS